MTFYRDVNDAAAPLYACLSAGLFLKQLLWQLGCRPVCNERSSDARRMECACESPRKGMRINWNIAQWKYRLSNARFTDLIRVMSLCIDENYCVIFPSSSVKAQSCWCKVEVVWFSSADGAIDVWHGGGKSSWRRRPTWCRKLPIPS